MLSRFAFLAAGLLASAALASTGVQIHVFDVGQAASELIVFPSGFSMLVDCGELYWNDHANADSVAEKVYDILGHKKVDVAVLSHMHLDHVGYAGKGGFWYLIEKKGFTFGKFIDRDAGVWVDKNKDGECDRDTEIKYNNIGSLSNTFSLWLCYATNKANSKIYDVRETAQVCSSDQIAPSDKLATVTITTVDAHGIKRKDGTKLGGDQSGLSTPPNENDYSVGLRINYGDFTYSTAGDLDGQYYSAGSYEYNDEESVVAKRVGEVDVLHVNHHGSSHSSNQKWLDTLKPTASIATLGYNNSYGHPDQDTLNRLLKAGDVYLTEKGEPSRKYGETVIANGDILVSVSADGSTYTISTPKEKRTYKSKGVSSPKCAV